MAMVFGGICDAERRASQELFLRVRVRQPRHLVIIARPPPILAPSTAAPSRCRLFIHGGRRHVAIPSEAAVSSLAQSRFGFVDAGHAGSRAELWELLEYNAHYFNPHRMAPILQQVLEEPLGQSRSDPRLVAYLKRATSSAQLYENLKDLTTRDIAAAIAAAREIGHSAAEDLSDVLVETVSNQMPTASLQRVSYFITAFAKKGIEDAIFWRAAARAVVTSTEPMNPQHVVSFFDAFRKSGLRSQRVYQSLAHRVYGVIEDFSPAHVPPIVATVCRVPLPAEERERLLRTLLSRWLSVLRQEREHSTGAVTVQQILSLTVSIGLVPDEINTAVFARDVSAYVGERFELLQAEDLIVFLWGMRRLVLTGSLTSFFSEGLLRVLEKWPTLQATAQLSVQRLTQLSEVLVEVRQEKQANGKELARLQDLVLRDLAESVQHCQAEGLAELLDIWAGHEAFWRHYRDFAEAATKRMEELLLESEGLDEVMPVLNAVVSVPGLVTSMPGRARQVLATAIQSRGAADVERIRAVLSGSPWEQLCSTPSDAATASTTTPSVESSRRDAHSGFHEFLMTKGRPCTDKQLADFLRAARDSAHGAEPALLALQTAAPFAQRFAAEASGEVFGLLTELGDELARDIESLEAPQVVAAMHACAVAGLPHVALFAAATRSLDTRRATPQLLVEAFEACAALRLVIPELKPWLDQLLGEGLELRLPAAALARLLAATARLALLDAEPHANAGASVDALLRRLVTVASSMRPLSLEAVATLCHGLYLSRWAPDCPEIFQVVAWLPQVDTSRATQAQAAALRHFAMSLLARPEGRTAAEVLGPDLQKALAETIMLRPSAQPHRIPISDTTLKFKHEVAETLLRAGRPYDLDVAFGPGYSADLAVLDGVRVLWLLDGPESFHRPFVDVWRDQDVESNGSRDPLLRLVPAELRRAELLASLRCSEEVAAMQRVLQQWAGGSSVASISEDITLGVRHGAAVAGPLARLHWLEWSAMSQHARVLALSDPTARPAVRRG